MVALGERRVAQLKQTGFAHAALYDPPGVGGTSVVTVLAHGDHPEWYSLPADPRVPRFVRFWKLLLQPLGALAVAATIAGAFVHYMRYGRKQPRGPGAGNAPAGAAS